MPDEIPAEKGWREVAVAVHKFGILGILSLTMLLHLSYLDVSQIWDGYIYYAKLLEALRDTASLPQFLQNFNIAGHPTMGYMALLAIGQWMDYGNTVLLNLSNLLLLLLAVWAFYKILIFFTPEAGNRIEMLMITLLFALNPVLFGAAIFFNADFPVAIFLVCVLYSLCYEKYFLAAVFGLLLVFSKETGIILYGGIITLFILVPMLFLFVPLLKRYAPTGAATSSRIHRWLFVFKLIGVVIPLPLSLYFYLGYLQTQNWLGGPIVTIGWDSHIAFTRLFQIFGMNFQWLLSLGILLALLWSCLTSQRRGWKLAAWNEKTYYLWALLIIWGGFVVMNLFLKTFTNVRYVLPATIFLLIFFAISFKKLFINRTLRLGLLAIIILLTGGQVFQTIDPVSRAFFGTAPFGKHALLKMTSVTGECCGHAGRDQLVYNAEFAMIPRLLDKMYAELPITGASNIIVHPLGNFNIFTPVDVISRKRTLKPDHSFLPRVYGLERIRRGELPEKGYYVYLPWMEDAGKELAFIRHFFQVQEKKSIDIRGYTLDVYPVTARGR